MSATGSRIREKIIIAALTPLAHWFVDVITAMPVGDPLTRPARLALAFDIAAVALFAMLIRRRSHPPLIAIGCALTIALSLSTFDRNVGALAESFAMLCAAGSLLVAANWRRSRARIVGAAALLVTGVALAPVAVMFTLLGVGAALLLASALEALPIGDVSRVVLLLALTVVLAVDRYREPSPETWRLAAWRDAVERALPHAATIYTRHRELAALHGPLFRGRPAGLRLQYQSDIAGDPTTLYVLEDPRAVVNHSIQRIAVRLPLDDVMSRLPAHTLVGVAMSRQLNAAGSPLVWFGPAPAWGAHPPQPAAAMQVLLGDAIGGSDQRAPTDIDLQAGEATVSVRVRGRDLVAGAGWGVAILRPDGPLVAAFSGDYAPVTLPLHIDGMQLYRVNPAPARP